MAVANEKVDVVIVGAGASGSVYASVLAEAGKKVVVLDNGPDWQLTDLISSDIWGRRLKPAGGPFCSTASTHSATPTRRLGASAAPRCITSRNFPRYLPTDFKIKSEHDRAHDWPISYQDVAPFTTRSRATSASPATPRRRRAGGRPVSPIRCRR